MISMWTTRSDKKRESAKRFGGARRATSKQHIDIDFSRYQQLGCKGCSLLDENLQHPRMPATGSKRPVIYIIGEAPGEDEDRQGEQFVGRTGKLLRQTLDDAASEYGDVKIRWNNCCRCQPPKNRTPERSEIERCRRSVVEDIEKSKPRILVAVGNTALQWAIDESTITKWRGKWVPAKIGNHHCWLYPIVHPSFVQRSQDKEGWECAFRHDILRLLQRAVGKELDVPRVEIPEDVDSKMHFVRDDASIRSLARQLDQWRDARASVAFDIETTCLRPYAVKDDPSFGWLSIAFSDGQTSWAVPISHREAGWSPDQREQLLLLILRFLRSSCMKIAHCLPFDWEWLSLIYGDNLQWRRRRWADTMVQAYVLDERRGGLSLDHLCKQRFGFRLKSQSNVNRAKLSDLRVEDLLRYNALDAKYTAKLYHVQREEVRRDRMVGIYWIHMQRVFTLVRAQQVGLVVDFDRVDEYKEKLDQILVDYEDKILRSKEAKLYKRKCGRELSPTSNDQLTVLFRDILGRKEGERSSNKSGYSTDSNTLSDIDLPIADNILNLRRYAKLKSTYVGPCSRDGPLVYPDGRLHTKFNDLFTVTGRLSSDDPNMQNFPKREDAWVRAVIVPPPGCVMLSVDYGQIEYRVIGMASKDKHICDSLNNRYDVHLDWAERVAKADNKVWLAYDKDIKKLRTEIKSNMVFPAFYGAGVDYIARLIGMDARKCAELFDQFWDEFSGVYRWQKKLLKFYEKHGYVECLSGRRRHAPLSRNKIFNSPIQGSASDIVLDAMNRLSVLSVDDPSLQAVMNIHDDLTFYVPRKRQDEVMNTIVREMLKPSYDWVTVPLSVEVSIGKKNWSAMKYAWLFFSDDI